MSNQLAEGLRQSLGPASRCAITPSGAFGDLLWGPDLSVAEIMDADGASVDALDNPRRIVFQNIRGQIRYFLTPDRDPNSSSYEIELGRVAGRQDAVALCIAFLDAFEPLHTLSATREVLHRSK